MHSTLRCFRKLCPNYMLFTLPFQSFTMSKLHSSCVKDSYVHVKGFCAGSGRVNCSHDIASFKSLSIPLFLMMFYTNKI